MSKAWSTIWRVTIASLSFGLLSSVAGAVVIDANSFKYVSTDPAKPDADDFHLKLTHGQFVDDPKTDKFPNLTNGGKGANTADFGGNALKNNSTLEVKLKSNQKFPRPVGYFTVGGVRKSADTRSLDLKGNPVAVVPSGSGFDVTLDLVNEFGENLTGSVSVYVNTGFATHFNLDDFDTLFGASLVLASSFVLPPDGGFFGIPVHLDSLDQYVLVTGVANAGDGLGDFAFSNAFSPVEVPEPHMLSLLVTGLGLAGSWRRTRSRSNSPCRRDTMRRSDDR
jgi:hypothetical protein